MQVTAIQRVVPTVESLALRVLACALRAMAPHAAGAPISALTQLLQAVQHADAFPSANKVTSAPAAQIAA